MVFDWCSDDTLAHPGCVRTVSRLYYLVEVVIMNTEIESLIALALKDGVINVAERGIILKKADALGLDREHVELLIEGACSSPNRLGDQTASVGIQKVCPSCNAPVEPFQQKCICDHVFQYNTLSSLIRDIQNDPSRERHIVANYQLPFSEATIIELFTFGYGKVQDDGLRNDIREVWFAKLSEILAMVETTRVAGIDQETASSMRRALNGARWISSIETQTVANDSSATELLEKVAKIKSRNRGDEIDSSLDEAIEHEVVLTIESYPIPSKKGELLNLIALCFSNGSVSEAFGMLRDEQMAWNKKAVSLIEKAKLMYSEDAAFVSQLNKLSLQMKKAERKSNIVTIIAGIVFAVAIVMWVRSC